jgi:hypothetical protein
MAFSPQKSANFKRETYTVLAGQTLTIDTQAYADFKSNKFLIDAKTATKQNSLEIFATKLGTDVSDSIYAKLGDSINLVFEFVKITSDAVLRVTNNELVSVEINKLKF